MPCFDAQAAQEDKDNRALVPFLTAALCMSLKAHQAIMESMLGEDAAQYSIFDGEFDFKEAGITREDLEEWWTKHKEEDRRRRIKEEREA